MSDEDRLKIVDFKKDTTRPDVIEALENLLERAKAGKLIAVYATCLLESGEVAVAISDTDDILKALGAIDYLRHRIVQMV